MDLREFVRVTLVEIAEGIADAQLQASHLVAITPGKLNGNSQAEVSEVEFDVAVTVASERGSESEKSDRLGGRIQVFPISLSGALSDRKKLKKATEEARVSRVRFRVPIQLSAWYRTDEELLPELKRRREAYERRKPLFSGEQVASEQH